MQDNPQTPECPCCLQTDRMTDAATTQTDVADIVITWTCRRCGIVAIYTLGRRPLGEDTVWKANAELRHRLRGTP